jgi:tRNA threonylcarbamoyladenosine biosynthesis protein TsaB
VAVGGLEPLSEVLLGRNTRHSEALLPAVEYALRLAAVKQRDLSGIVVAGGPGSFTGLRIAGATAKALARSLEIPLYSYSGLLAIAAASTGQPVCALLDARRNEVYAACYRVSAERIETLVEPVAVELDELLGDARIGDAVFAGEGAVKHEAAIRAAGFEVAIAPAGVPHASALLWLAAHHPGHGIVESLHDWEPEYLRESGAERSLRA